MKTVAIKVDDELHAQLTVIAQLENVTITEIIRDAVVNHLDTKRADGSLAARAEAVLADIDREAASRKEALSGLLAASGVSGKGAKSTGRSGGTRSRSRKTADSEQPSLGES